MYNVLDLRSRLRRDLLAYYFTNPSAQHYLRELAGVLDVDPANLSRELADLERDGLFISTFRGRQKYFRLNRRFPLFRQLRQIVQKTIGVEGQLREALRLVGGLEAAYLVGSFAEGRQDASSDLDLLLVGEPKPENLAGAVRRLERRLGRSVDYTLLSSREFVRRKVQKDPYLEDLWRRPRVELVSPS